MIDHKSLEDKPTDPFPAHRAFLSRMIVPVKWRDRGKMPAHAGHCGAAHASRAVRPPSMAWVARAAGSGRRDLQFGAQRVHASGEAAPGGVKPGFVAGGVGHGTLRASLAGSHL